MNVKAKFIGKIITLDYIPGVTSVILKNTKTEETKETNIISQKLIEKNINYNGCEFEVLIQDNENGKLEGVINKLEPLPITPERVKEIKNEYEGRWDFLDNL